MALLLARFTAHAKRSCTLTEALCATSVEALQVHGAGVSLHTASGDLYSVGVSGHVMAQIQELERTLGEGPCVDAWKLGEPVAEPDLANPKDASRWLAFTTAALRVGARASFGYPVGVGDTRLGALNLYSTNPRALDVQQHETALALAELTVHIVVSEMTAATPAAFMLEVDQIGPNQLEVHQATGMISVQLAISTSDALARLRAHAFAGERPLCDVAADVVARRLRFEP